MATDSDEQAGGGPPDGSSGMRGTFIQPSALGRVAIELPDGRVLDGGPIFPALPDGSISLLCGIDRFNFDQCPICGSKDGLTAEHVPPDSLGGHKQTRTCGPCNHRLATLAEADLAAWYQQKLLQVTVAHADVRGERRVSSITVWESTEGEFLLGVQRPDPAIHQMLVAGGEIALDFEEADPLRYQVAMLKHAYLAACLHLREIPQSPVADAIRLELIALRDAPDQDNPPASPLSQTLAMGRTSAPQTHKLQLGVSTPLAGPPNLVILLGNTWAGWPITDPPIVERALVLARDRQIQ